MARALWERGQGLRAVLLLLELFVLLLFFFFDGDSFLRCCCGGAASAGRPCRRRFPLVGALELQGRLCRSGPLQDRSTVLVRVFILR